MLDICWKNIVKVSLLTLVCFDVKNVSVVYNIKISETTKRSQGTNKLTFGNKLKPAIGTITLIDQDRRTYDNIHQNSVAALATLFYSPGVWYLRLESAAGHVKNEFPIPVDLITSRTQMDDLVFSGGYSLEVGDRARVTLSGLLGIPLHRDVGLLGAQFGTGHVGLGAQLDAAYAYSENKQHALMGAVRYIRFLSRTAEACINQHLVPFDLSLGNLMDVLFATHSSWGKHQWEAGYNATFAFGAQVNPPIPGIEDQIQFMRSSFYTTYGYLFPIRTHMSGIAFGVSYGFDHRPQCLGFKRMVAGWFTWGINF
jgi:hypothetical protein